MMPLLFLTPLLDALAGRRQALDGPDDAPLDLDVEQALVDETEPEITRVSESAPIVSKLPLPKAPPKPIWVGDPLSAMGMKLLREMHGVWVICGATDTRITTREFCTLPKAPSRPIAIPPRALWPWTAALIRDVWTPLRDRVGAMNVRGYRPPSYNKAVKGSKRSDHQWACALDLRPAAGQSVRVLKREAARLYVERGADLELGFGGYAGNIHVGAGIRQRYWGDAGQWIRLARAARGE